MQLLVMHTIAIMRIEKDGACANPDAGLGSVPWRHVVLGLSLAKLANSASNPFSVDVPAAHLHWPWPAVIGLWLLSQKEEKQL